MCDQCASDQTCVEDWLGNNAGPMMERTLLRVYTVGRHAPVNRPDCDFELKKNSEPVRDVYKSAAHFMKFAGMPGPETDGYKTYLSKIAQEILELIDRHRSTVKCFSPNSVILRGGDGYINIICPTCMTVLRSVEK